MSEVQSAYAVAHAGPLTTDADEEWMQYKSVPLEPLPMDDTPDAAAANVTPDPFLTQWNANVKVCEACKVAQKASDDEYMDDHVAWCDEHRAQFNAWGTRAAATNVTVYVAGIGNVRMSPDDALRMLFEEVLEDARIDYVQAYHDLMSDAVLQDQWDTYAARMMARLAALLGDGVK